MKTRYDLGMKWNERLRHARDAAGVTDTDIARVCGLSNPTVHAWMKGSTKHIEAQNLLMVCDFLKVSPHWIILGKEVEAPRTKESGAKELEDAFEVFLLYKDSSPAARSIILDISRRTHAADKDGSLNRNETQLG